MKPPLILLHGALGAGKQLQPLQAAFEADFEVNILTFHGHGGQPSTEAFTMDEFAKQVLDFMDEQRMPTANFFGYSMGGYVALWLARHDPNRVNQVITLGTKLEWTPDVYEQQKRGLNPEKIETKVPAFAEALKQLHAPLDWKEVVRKTDAMMADLAAGNKLNDEDFNAIAHRVVLLLGDQDRMVTEDETKHVAGLLKNGSFEALSGIPHPIEQLNPEDLSKILLTTFNKRNATA